MATRFYLPSSGSPPVTPFTVSGWEADIGGAHGMFTTKQSTAMATVSYDDADATNQDILYKRYVSAPMTAQTISAVGFKLQIRGSETNTGNNLFVRFSLVVISNDGLSQVGVLLGQTTDNVELATSLTNRQCTATLSSVSCSAGDRLQLQIGVAGDPAAGQSHDSSLRFGDTAAGDLAENDTSTSDDNPWIEIAQDLVFQSAGGQPPRAMQQYRRRRV